MGGSASMVSGGSNPSLHQALKHLQLSTKSDIQSEKTAQSSAMHMPMSVSNWPPVGKLLSNWLNRVLQIWLASTVGLWWVYPRKESRELERTDSHRHNAPTEQSTPTSRLYLSHTRFLRLRDF
uniref:Uncharacterized protein n=1 Tax=Helianthus annuus TaxID=4232 RepID=A0A251U0E3_HELAN